MNEQLQSWNAALHRVLDVLAASAQPVVSTAPIPLYRWGKDIRDDLGDNAAQYGLHGTTEAVLALAAGVNKFGAKSRYQRFLSGGVLSLTEWLDVPKKKLDLLKTIKISEWLGALADGGSDKANLDKLSNQLLKAREPSTGGWGWNSQVAADSTLLPTLYALDSLLRVDSRFHLYDQEVQAGIRFCLKEIEVTKPSAEYEEVYAWETCLYKLCEIVRLHETIYGEEKDSRSRLETMLQLDSNLLHPTLKEFKRFEYRIQVDVSEEQHVFCVLPVGLMQLWVELWAQSVGLNIGWERRMLEERIEEFFRLIYSPLDFPFNIVGSCAYAARLLAEYGVEMEAYLTPVSASSSENEAVTPAPETPEEIPDPFEKPSMRQQLYKNLLSHDSVADVDILQPLLGGYSGAHLDLCELTLTDGTPEILQVLKLDKAHNVEQEKTGVEAAQRQIDRKYCVHLIGSYRVPDTDKGVLRFEYADSTLAPGRIKSFLSFLYEESSTEDVVAIINAIYQKALKRVLASIKSKHTSLIKVKNHFESVRGNKFWSEVVAGFAKLQQANLVHPTDKLNRLLLQFPFKTVQDPFDDSPQRRELWDLPFQGALAGYAHGDLNPRNILIIRDEDGDYYSPVLIDFHRFGPWVPLAVDFARLEAGIQIKGLRNYINDAIANEEKHESLIRYEKWINGSLLLEAGDSVSPTLPGELRKVATFVRTIRANYNGRVPIDKQETRPYFSVLLFNYLSYLRPTYDRVLTNEQKLFAFYSAACIHKRHFVDPMR